MKKLTKKKMWVFAVGQLGWSILAGIIVNWLVYFYQPDPEVISLGHKLYISQGKEIFGILTVVGAIVAFGRIFDGFTDPLIASASDRSKNKNGRRIPFMKWSAFPFALMTVLIFFMPSQSIGGINNVWLVIAVLLFYLFMTFYTTPYTALIPELGKNQNDKINISTFISVTFIVGQALAFSSSFIWGIFISGGMERMSAIRLTFGILAFIAFICMMIPVIFIREKDYVNEVSSDSTAFESLLKTLKNKDFRIFLASDISYWIAVTIFQTGLSFFIVGLLKLNESMVGVLFIFMTLVSFLFYFPVNILAKKFGKKNMVIIAFVMFGFAFFITSLAGLTAIPNVLYGYLIAILAAIPMAILGILPQAIVADIAQSDSKDNNENREGMFFAARTFLFKLGQSLSILIFTSLATIGRSTGLGYRLALFVAIGFSVLGALFLLRYNEKRVLKSIDDLN
ncbi:MAG: MFS transporter [Bacillota bacterium]